MFPFFVVYLLTCLLMSMCSVKTWLVVGLPKRKPIWQSQIITATVPQVLDYYSVGEAVGLAAASTDNTVWLCSYLAAGRRQIAEFGIIVLFSPASLKEASFEWLGNRVLEAHRKLPYSQSDCWPIQLSIVYFGWQQLFPALTGDKRDWTQDLHKVDAIPLHYQWEHSNIWSGVQLVI